MQELQIGDKVVRGPDWDKYGFGKQDGEVGSIGIVMMHVRISGWCDVRWPNGNTYGYPYNKDSQGIIPITETEEETMSTSISTETKLSSGEDNIERAYAKTKNARLVKNYMAGEVGKGFASYLFLRENKVAFLKEAKKRKVASEK